MKKRTKLDRDYLVKTFNILAKKLNDEEFALVCGTFNMLFVGHKFGLEPDGFDLINIGLESKKNYKKTLNTSRHGNIIKLKPEISR
jgi:hypothetical protein